MIAEAIQKLNKEAEKIRNTDPQDVSNIEVGDEFIQGDLRIKRLPNNAIDQLGNRLSPIETNLQLVAGQSNGSRHCLAHSNGVEMFKLENGNALDGPIVKLTEPNSITHPSHGDVINIPVGCYAFPGQRTFAEELRRVTD